MKKYKGIQRKNSPPSQPTYKVEDQLSKILSMEKLQKLFEIEAQKDTRNLIKDQISLRSLSISSRTPYRSSHPKFPK